MGAFEDRLKRIEELLGAKVPADCIAILRPGRAWPKTRMGLLRPDGPIVVSHFYELSDGEDYCQLDETYELVHDVLPRYALPIASDPFGNFYCLFVDGPQKGTVVFWDHERDLGDDSTKTLSDSLRAFIDSVQPLSAI